MRFQVGDKVKFNSPTGSFGEVVGIYRFAYENRESVCVEFHSGVNRLGEPIKSYSRRIYAYELIKVDPEFYNKYTRCLAWSLEQRKLREEYDMKCALETYNSVSQETD